jgi:hypothetical protein
VVSDGRWRLVAAAAVSGNFFSSYAKDMTLVPEGRPGYHVKRVDPLSLLLAFCFVFFFFVLFYLFSFHFGLFGLNFQCLLPSSV